MTKLTCIFFTVLFFIANAAASQNIDSVQQKINYYLSQAKLDSAKTYIQSNLNTVGKKQDKSALNYQLVKVLFMQSAYEESLQQAFDSLDDISDEKERVNFNFLIGCIYSAISDYGKSVEYFDLVAEHNRDPSLAVQTYLLLSELHINLGDSLNAGNSLTEAYKITNVSDVDSRVKGHVAMQYNFFNKNYEACKEQNFKIVRDSTNFLNTRSYAYSMIGDCLVKQDSLTKATEYFDEFLKLTFETRDPEQIKVAANKLIEVHEKLGDQEKANAYHKIYNEAVNDSLSFSVEKYRDLYNIEKERELATAKSKNLRNYLIFGIAFLVLISLGVYYHFKSRNIKKTPGKKIIISDSEVEKIGSAIDELKSKKLFLTPNITRKSFCSDNRITSERYLSQFINEKYKKSFSIFINDLRIEYAHHRIQEDAKFRSYKIEEIAKECGFGSKKSFERAFLAKYQETPFKLISRLTN